LTSVVISKLNLVDQLFHTVASPSVAYLCLAVAVGLLIFEFFTAGVGVAGLVGAVAAVLAGYGLGILPHRTWALVLAILAGVAFMIDVQAGVPRFWTMVGLIAWVVGSVFLFGEVGHPWIALTVGIVGIAVAMVSGMPAMVRSRFGTPTIGREWMIGETGEAMSAVSPDGVVRVSGASWRARTNRATPIAEGESIRVVAIDGLTLEVEPEEGGAIDYREMRSRRRGGADAHSEHG
jgi:membrane-bound serine protease (ClpP class)